MRLIVVVAVALLTLTAAQSSAAEGFQPPRDVEFVSGLDGSVQRYVVLVPETFDSTRPLDVMIALHGHGSDRWQFVQQERAECRESRRVAAEAGMLFVSPDYRASTSWMGPAAEADLQQILDRLHQEYRIRNVVLCGGSMGAMSALAFAAQHPEAVDGVVALNGTANMLEYDQFQDAIQVSYGGSREQQPDIYRTRSAELFSERLTMPVATTTGGRDALVPAASVLRLTAALEKQGTPVKAIHRPEGGHETNAEDTRAALRFVLDTLAARRDLPQPRPVSVTDTAPQKTLKVVCLGDSVTGVYYHTGGRRAYPEMLQLALAKVLPGTEVSVINAGISGQTTADGLSRLDRDVLSHAPQVVTISFGLNDVTRIPRDQYRRNLEELVRRCTEKGAKVVLCTPNAVMHTDARPVAVVEDYCQILREVAEETDAMCCDQYAAGQRLKGRAPMTWRQTLSDEIHPNMDGHKRMAEELCFCLTGQSVSLSTELPPEPVLPRTRARLTASEPVRVLVMKPLEPALRLAAMEAGMSGQLQVTVWDTEGKSLQQLETEAQSLVRPLKPDLVLLTFPGHLDADSDEQRIRSISWIMNWSLDFGNNGWDCVVVYPGDSGAAPRSADRQLIERLVAAQDLPLVTVSPDDGRSMNEVFGQWFRAAVTSAR